MATAKKGTRPNTAKQVTERVEESRQEHTSPFEAIRRINEHGNEFWSARELAKVLGYTRYDKFTNAIKKAEAACAASGNEVDNHMSHVRHMVQVGSGALREVKDVNLSRYACYLTVQNADPTKEIVALAQTYFAAQTRRQETFDQVFASMDEAQRRLFMHNQMVTQNEKLKAVAGQAGVVTPEDFAIFQNHGYIGLYGGLHEQDLQQRKGLSDNQNVLDYMSSEELISNMFRSSQTESKMVRDNVKQKEQANSLHKEVGSAVRQTIQQLGGTLPENLPTPAASIHELKQLQDSAARQLLQNTPVAKPARTKAVKNVNKSVEEIEMSNPIEDKVKQDLAKRLKAQSDDVTVKSNQSVTWRDGSLGYPEPGMMYTMALVPGHRIKLQHKGKTYEYHTDGIGKRIVYCENTSKIQDPA